MDGLYLHQGGAVHGFSLEEARAGHALAERAVAKAQAALAAAGGRREGRRAEADLETRARPSG